jgi:hypothetical protein
MATDQNLELQASIPTQQTQQTQRARRRRSDFIDVDNPLRGVDLETAVERFVYKTQLTDLKDIILRGAYLAEDPDNFPNVVGNTPRDHEALKRESEETGPFKILSGVPKQLRTIIITCSVAAITQFVQALDDNLYHVLMELYLEDGIRSP